MNQDSFGDLFSSIPSGTQKEGEPTSLGELRLPAVRLGPITTAIGSISQLIDPEVVLNIVSKSEVLVTSRTKADCFELSDGQKIVLTSHKKPSLPVGVSGALGSRENGELYWIKHRNIDVALSKLNDPGANNLMHQTQDQWRGKFVFQQEKEGKNTGLRPPQIGALHAIGAHWSLSTSPATVIMPTGTGKTETMLSALSAYRCGPMLVVVPSKELRTQISNKFFDFGLLKKIGVLDRSAPYPVVGIVTKRPKTADDLDIFSKCNVVVSVVDSLSGGTATPLATEIAKRCECLIVDEAHHVTAGKWAILKSAFSKKRIVQFTATPFREDRQLVDGDVIFSYSMKAAQEDGYFKPITLNSVHELSEIQGDRAIAEQAISVLRNDMENGYDHQLMARCRTIERAAAVLKFYLEMGADLDPVLVHSEVPDGNERLERLKSGESKIVVCVDMLGEGFDLPSLKIAALHDPHKSLAPSLQFIGRFTRSSGQNLGDATVVANLANVDFSNALERLYIEDADWNTVLSELSSSAAREHFELLQFLKNSRSLDDDDEMPTKISQQLLRPTLSALFFTATSFTPKKFPEGLVKGLEIEGAWLNQQERTLFFVTRMQQGVKWTRAKDIKETNWGLVVVHFDETHGVLAIGTSDTKFNAAKLAKVLGASGALSGELIFRCLGNVGRLMFQNLGVSKHGRRNLSYAMYTGSDVKQALSLTEKQGSRKSNLSATGWEDGSRVSIGCSYKGRVWSREGGPIPKFVKWARHTATKLLDDNIDTKSIIDSVLIPEEIHTLPTVELMGIEWPVELLGQSEERVVIASGKTEESMFALDIRLADEQNENGSILFDVIRSDESILGSYGLKLDKKFGYIVAERRSANLQLVVGKNQQSLVDYFNDYPPLIRYVDLSELDGNLLISPENPQEFRIPSDSLEVWNWKNVEIQHESIWKGQTQREHTVQGEAAKKFCDDGFTIVFDDDDAGEAADLVCIRELDSHIQVLLAHCKFSGGVDAGRRVKDAVEVSSQAIRSTKWSGRFKELCRHLNHRETHCRSSGRLSRFIMGSNVQLRDLLKASRFKEVRVEIVIIQPGISKSRLSVDQSMVLGAASSYIKETIGDDLDIICSD